MEESLVLALDALRFFTRAACSAVFIDVISIAVDMSSTNRWAREFSFELSRQGISLLGRVVAHGWACCQVGKHASLLALRFAADLFT